MQKIIGIIKSKFGNKDTVCRENIKGILISFCIDENGIISSTMHRRYDVDYARSC